MPYNPYTPFPVADAALRIICLPHAGGGSAIFHRWRSAMPDRLAIVPVCLPGREGRIDEPHHAELRPLVTEVVDAIEPLVDRPYVLLGHSMGAWITFEMAHELLRRSLPLPRLLIAAASRAPDATRSGGVLHPLADEEFVVELSRQFDGVPPAVRDNDELLKLLLPALRADIRMAERYQYEPRPPLDVDILAVGGTEDPAVSAADLADWRRHTTQKFSVRLVPGDHFFLFRQRCRGNSELPDAAQMICQQLRRYIDNGQ